MSQPVQNADPFFNDNKPASFSKFPLVVSLFVLLTVLTTALYIALSTNKQPTSADVQRTSSHPAESSGLQYIAPLTPPAPQ